MKRFFDLFVSINALFLLTPVFLFILILIKINSRGPFFFRQNRVGRNGEIFRIHKFRTMFEDSEYKGRLTIGNDNRITNVGKILRKYKLDELPQLIDVLYGKMSLVGPRPEVEEFINDYPDRVKFKVLSVRPGITDMASILMINENEILASYDDPSQAYKDIILPIKIKHYVEYIDNQSIWLDLKIIFLTLKKIVF